MHTVLSAGPLAWAAPAAHTRAARQPKSGPVALVQLLSERIHERLSGEKSMVVQAREGSIRNKVLSFITWWWYRAASACKPMTQ